MGKKKRNNPDKVFKAWLRSMPPEKKVALWLEMRREQMNEEIERLFEEGVTMSSDELKEHLLKFVNQKDKEEGLG